MSQAPPSFPEHAELYPHRRRVGLLLLVVFLIATALSCAAGVLLFGNRVYYRDWNSVRTWSRPKPDTGLLPPPGDVSQNWYATVDRHSKRSILMKTDNDYALGMILIVRSENSTVEGYAQRQRRARWWKLTETTGNGRDQRRIEVRADSILVGEIEFSRSAGRLVLIDENGDVTQHAFTTEAQSSAQLEADVQKFIAELPQP